MAVLEHCFWYVLQLIIHEINAIIQDTNSHSKQFQKKNELLKEGVLETPQQCCLPFRFLVVKLFSSQLPGKLLQIKNSLFFHKWKARRLMYSFQLQCSFQQRLFKTKQPLILRLLLGKCSLNFHQPEAWQLVGYKLFSKSCYRCVLLPAKHFRIHFI